MNQVLTIGHRGAKGHAPENTIASFEKAIEMGVDMDQHPAAAATGQPGPDDGARIGAVPTAAARNLRGLAQPEAAHFKQGEG